MNDKFDKLAKGLAQSVTRPLLCVTVAAQFVCLARSADHYVDPNAPAGGDGSGGYFIRFNGVPGVSYRLQRASGVTGPWTTSASQTAPASGLVEFWDLFPPP